MGEIFFAGPPQDPETVPENLFQLTGVAVENTDDHITFFTECIIYGILKFLFFSLFLFRSLSSQEKVQKGHYDKDT